MSDKEARFIFLCARIDQLVVDGNEYFSRGDTLIPEMTEESWSRFLESVAFFKSRYSNPSRWVVVPYLPFFFGLNLFSSVVLVDSTAFYKDWRQAVIILIHEPQHDFRRFGMDKPHKKPGYQWDALIGSMISNCEMARKIARKFPYLDDEVMA